MMLSMFFTIQSYDKNLKTLVLVIKSEYILNGEVPIGGKYNLQK